MSLPIDQTHLITSTAADWDKILTNLVDSGFDIDPFFRHNVVKALASSTSQPYLSVFFSQEGILIEAFLMRSFNFSLRDRRYSFNDTTSPYGSSGLMFLPITTPLPSAELASTYEDSWRDFTTKNNIISSFLRHCPLTHSNHLSQLRKYQTTDIREYTVVNSTDLQQSDIIKSFRHSHRKHVKKCLNHQNLCFSYTTELRALEAFCAGYNQSMQSLNADPSYFLSNSSIHTLSTNPSSYSIYTCQTNDHQILSSELVFHSKTRFYSMFGYTTEPGREFCANYGLKYYMFTHFFQHSSSWHYYLGGGLASGDGISRYKSGFSPSCTLMSSIAFKLYNPSLYQQLKLDYEHIHGPTSRYQFYESIQS